MTEEKVIELFRIFSEMSLLIREDEKFPQKQRNLIQLGLALSASTYIESISGFFKKSSEINETSSQTQSALLHEPATKTRM